MSDDLNWLDRLPDALVILERVTGVDIMPDHPLASGFLANETPTVVVARGGGLVVQHPGGTVPLPDDRALLQPPGAANRFATAGDGCAFQFIPVQEEVACSMVMAGSGGEPRWRKGSVLGPGGEAVRHLLMAVIAAPGPEQAWNTFDLTRRAIVESLQRESRFAPGGPNLAARARSLLAERFRDPGCGVRSLAEELGCSPDHLGRVFRKRGGSGLRAELVELRLEHARRLLRAERQTSIADVARRSGFRSASRLCEHFMAAQGVTPSAYRRFGHTQ